MLHEKRVFLLIVYHQRRKVDYLSLIYSEFATFSNDLVIVGYFNLKVWLIRCFMIEYCVCLCHSNTIVLTWI